MSEAFAEFIAMNGYGAYIWPAYGLTLGVILALIIRTALREYRIVQMESAFEENRQIHGQNYSQTPAVRDEEGTGQ